MNLRLFTGLSGLILLISVWLVTRAVLLADTLSGSIPLDVVAYSRWAEVTMSGGSSATDTAFVYPPGSTLVFIAPNLLPFTSYLRSFTILTVLVDLAILISLWLFVRKSPPRLIIAPWAWVVMGFAAGPLMYQRYDLFAAFLGVLAVIALSRPIISGGLAGLGLLVKLWPEIAVLGLPRERMVRGLVANVTVVLVGWGLLHIFFGNSLTFLSNVFNKGTSVEATAAYPFLLARALNSSHKVKGQFGSWDVLGPGVGALATVITIVGILLLVGIFVLRLRGRLDHVAPGDIVLLGVLVFVATHKINSLQYGVWIAAMTAVALAFASSRALGPAALLTLMLLVADQAIWRNFESFLFGDPLMLVYQGTRLALLLAATVWLAVTFLRPRKDTTGEPSLRPKADFS
jgi:hypothetical protein